jgi:hypothetical protein
VLAEAFPISSIRYVSRIYSRPLWMAVLVDLSLQLGLSVTPTQCKSRNELKWFAGVWFVRLGVCATPGRLQTIPLRGKERIC